MEQTNKTDSGDLELESPESKIDVPKTEDLENQPSEEEEYYKKITGREDIKSKADFEKHYEGMRSLVGDQKLAELRKKAEKYETLQTEINKDADEFAKTPEGEKTAKDFAEGVIEDRVNQLEEDLKMEKFFKGYPEAQPIINLVKAKSSQNKISFEDAYAKPLEGEKYSLKDLLASKLEVEKNKSEEITGIESKSRVSLGDSAEISQLVEKVQKEDTFEAKQKLVEKSLGLSK